MIRSRRIFLLSLGLFCLAPLHVPAADKPAPVPDPAGVIYPHSTESHPDSPAGRGSGYPMILVAALLLAGAGGWLFWRGRTTPGGIAAVRKLAIAETKSLGNRQYLVVASYDDKKYLLSVCPGRIDLLTPLDGPASSKSP